MTKGLRSHASACRDVLHYKCSTLKRVKLERTKSSRRICSVAKSIAPSWAWCVKKIISVSPPTADSWNMDSIEISASDKIRATSANTPGRDRKSVVKGKSGGRGGDERWR